MKCPHCGKRNEPANLDTRKRMPCIVWHVCSRCGSKYGQRTLPVLATTTIGQKEVRV